VQDFGDIFFEKKYRATIDGIKKIAMKNGDNSV
jgi:hypothetical protein